MILLLDDIISKFEQKTLVNSMLGNPSFPWSYAPDVTATHSDNPQRRPAMMHWFCGFMKNQVSGYEHLLTPIITNAAHEMNMKEVNVIQARSFLQFPLDSNFTGEQVDTPHIDSYDPHWVFLYYLFDNDAETIIYKNKMKDRNELPPLFDELEESIRIKPKAGRLVIFDGMHWHTANQTKTGVRCIINIDVRK